MSSEVKSYSMGRGGFIAILIVAFAATLWFWQETLFALVDTWNSSGSYAHGYLIAPISIWLIWQRRAWLTTVELRPSLLGLLAISFLATVWLAGRVVDVQLVTQLSFSLIIGAWVFALAGWAYTRVILFPLGFMVLAVPMGEELVEPLMVLTADFVVWALNVINIPVYREGLVFELPTGSWSVAKACSGIRYLVASVTLGVLYAYMNYRSLWRRIAFVAFSIVLPIAANALRALLIVLLGHYSDMQIAVGVDHLIYGWVFFGIIIFLMFWIGSLWAEPLPQNRVSAKQVSNRYPANAIFALVIGIAIVSLSAHAAQRMQQIAPAQLAEGLPAPAGWESMPVAVMPWQPSFQKPDAETYWQQQNVGLYVAAYTAQRQGAELINESNQITASSDKRWYQYPEQAPEGLPIPVTAAVIHDLRERRILVWRLRWLDGQWVRSGVEAKLSEALNVLQGQPSPGVGMLLFTPFLLDKSEAEQRLQRVMREQEGQISAAVDRLFH